MEPIADRISLIQDYCFKSTTSCGMELEKLLVLLSPDGGTINIGDWFKDYPLDDTATKIICDIDRGVTDWKGFYDEVHRRYPSVKYALVTQNYGSVDFTGCNFDVLIVNDSQSCGSPSGKIVYAFSLTMGYGYMCQNAGEIIVYQQSNGMIVVYGFLDQCIEPSMKEGLETLNLTKISQEDLVISVSTLV